MCEQYLFLDIDGVLNTTRYGFYLEDNNMVDEDEEGADVKIIISSTWRFKGWEWMNKLWKNRQLPGKIYSFTPGLEFVRFKDDIHRTYSESVYPYGTRGLKIGE